MIMKATSIKSMRIWKSEVMGAVSLAAASLPDSRARRMVQAYAHFAKGDDS
jgi:hypothetical protein